MYIQNVHGIEFATLRALKDYLLVLIIFLAVFKFFLSGNIYIHRSYLLWFILLLICATYKVFTLGDALSIDFFRFFFFGPLVFIISINFFRSEFVLYKIIYFVIAISFIVSIIGIYQFLFIDILQDWSIAAGQKRITSTLFSPNALAWYLVCINTVILSILFFRDNSFKYLLFIIFIFNLIAIFLSGSRTGVISTFISIIIHFFLLPYKMRLRLILYFVFSLPFLLSLFFFTSVMDNRAVSSLDDTRALIYNELWNRLDILPFQEYLFGVNKTNLLFLKELALLDDSFIFSLLPIFGIIGFIFVMYILYRIFSISFLKSNTILSISLVMFILMSLVGNVLYIYPHSIFFWFLAGLGKNLTNIKKVAKKNSIYRNLNLKSRFISN
jgi:putative inorganic carbon (hco3(-)) transporter